MTLCVRRLTNNCTQTPIVTSKMTSSYDYTDHDDYFDDVLSYVNETDFDLEDSGAVGGYRKAGDFAGKRSVFLRLKRFSNVYAHYHGYLSLFVCAIGIVSSLLIIAVLTRRHMISSANYMLTALAVCDLVTMIWVVPWVFQYYCRYGTTPSPDRDTFVWAQFSFVYANVSVVAHTCSIWIAVALSAFRYAVVRRSTEGRGTSGSGHSDLRTSRLVVVGVCLSSILVLIPNYMTMTISDVIDANSNRTYYQVDMTFDTPIGLLNFWVHALLVKLVPCLLMSVFGCLLVATVRRHTAHRKKLRAGLQKYRQAVDSGAAVAVAVGPRSGTVAAAAAKRTGSGDGGPRTTAMLISVIVLFLVTELPQGVLAIFCGVHPEYFGLIYSPLGDLMDLVALVNNAINFVLYCAMSRQFRMTFIQLFTRRRQKQSNAPGSTTPLRSQAAIVINNVNGLSDKDEKMGDAAAALQEVKISTEEPTVRLAD